VCVELRSSLQASIDNSCPDETRLPIFIWVYRVKGLTRSSFLCVSVCVCFNLCVLCVLACDLVQAGIDNSCFNEGTAL